MSNVQLESEEGTRSLTSQSIHLDKATEEFLTKNGLTSLREGLIKNDLSIEDISNLPASEQSDFNQLCDLLQLTLQQKFKFRTSLKKLQQLKSYEAKFQQLRSKYIVTQASERYLKLYRLQTKKKHAIGRPMTPTYYRTQLPSHTDLTGHLALSGLIPTVNAIVIGESQAGKTSMILKMTQSNFVLVENDAKSTTRVDNNYIMIDINAGIDDDDNKLSENFTESNSADDTGIVTLNLWDSAGQEEYRNQVLNKTILRNKDAIIMCYDTSNDDSFNKLEKWYQQVIDIIDPKDVAVLIVGCKNDKKKSEYYNIQESKQNMEIIESKSQYVVTETAKQYAFKIGASWSDCSAKTGEGIIETMVLICQRVYKRQKRQKLQQMKQSEEKKNKQQVIDLSQARKNEQIKPPTTSCIC